MLASRPAFSTLDADAGRPSALSSGPLLVTVTVMGVLVVWLPAASRARAVRVCWPLAAPAVFQLVV